MGNISRQGLIKSLYLWKLIDYNTLRTYYTTIEYAQPAIVKHVNYKKL